MNGPAHHTAPNHIALVMDGNRRWAEAKGLDNKQGHEAGVKRLREIVRAASDLKIPRLTVYGFSLDNWQRSEKEVSTLFDMVRNFLREDLAELHENNVRLKFLGTEEGLADDILALIREAEELTANNQGLVFAVAFNYGSRNEIVRAALALSKEGCLTQEKLEASLDPPVDLLVRTGGEQRLSDFLLWQSAYAELVFVEAFWPDFTPELFQTCLAEYHQRTRRFGGDKEEG